MEMKLSSSGELLGASGGCSKKRPPSRLQKQAPASLLLEPVPGAQTPPAAWGDGRTPIPLLSPLIVSPAAAWEADQAATRREGEQMQGGGGQAEGRSGGDGGSAARHGAHGGGNGERQVDEAGKAPAPGGVWRHPALPTPVAEPASLVPFFQSQCALEARNAQQ